jgi:hypothetical protein
MRRKRTAGQSAYSYPSSRRHPELVEIEILPLLLQFLFNLVLPVPAPFEDPQLRPFIVQYGVECLSVQRHQMNNRHAFVIRLLHTPRNNPVAGCGGCGWYEFRPDRVVQFSCPGHMDEGYDPVISGLGRDGMPGPKLRSRSNKQQEQGKSCLTKHRTECYPGIPVCLSEFFRILWSRLESHRPKQSFGWIQR